MALIGAETLLRLAWTPPILRSTIASEAHLYYRAAGRPGISGEHHTSEYVTTFSHTAQGLRGDKLFQRELPAGIEKRVLFLGDSFTYGTGASNDETFIALLDKAWPNIEVINAGFSGYGQREELAVLDQLGEALHPDITVLVFFWNDVEDNLKRTKPDFQFSKNGSVERVDLQVPDDFDPLALRVADEIDEESRAGQTSFVKRLWKGGVRGFRYRLFGMRQRLPTTIEEWQQGWELTTKYLAMMKSRAEALGSDFLVVSIPGQNRVDPTARIKGIEPLAFEVEEKLREVSASLGIPYIDLMPHMMREHQKNQGSLYFYADRHLTPLGNAAVAAALSESLENLIWPDRL